MCIDIDIYYFKKENILILVIKKCFLFLSVEEWNVVYCDISHRKLERSLFYKLSEVKCRGMRGYNKSTFVNKLSITPYLQVY